MKAIILTLLATSVFSLMTGISQDDHHELKAFYQGYEDGNYVFEDNYGETYEFNKCSKEILAQFDLSSDKLITQAFLITYLKSNEEEDYSELEIVKIKMTTIENEEYGTDETDDDENE
jgi:hypothetical protein